MSITPITGDWRRFCEIVYDPDEERACAELLPLLRRCAFAHPEWATRYILGAWDHAAVLSLADARREHARAARLLRLDEIRDAFDYYGVDKAEYDALCETLQAPYRDAWLASMPDEERERQEFLFTLILEEFTVRRRALAGFWTKEPLRELADDEWVGDAMEAPASENGELCDNEDGEGDEEDEDDEGEGDEDGEPEMVPEILLTLELRVWLAAVSKARAGRVTLNQQEVARELHAWQPHISRAVRRLRERALIVSVGKEGRSHVFELPTPWLGSHP